MDFETVSYPITAPQIVSSKTEHEKSQQKPFQITIKVDSFINDTSASIIITAEQLRSITNSFSYPRKKENYFVLAINNLVKKSDFLQLSLQHAERIISDEEFENELENNSDKYIIDLKEIEDNIDINIVSEIVAKLDREFTIDEVCELFSIAPHRFMQNYLFIGK